SCRCTGLEPSAPYPAAGADPCQAARLDRHAALCLHHGNAAIDPAGARQPGRHAAVPSGAPALQTAELKKGDALADIPNPWNNTDQGASQRLSFSSFNVRLPPAALPA